jgi:hypothetical protein
MFRASSRVTSAEPGLGERNERWYGEPRPPIGYRVTATINVGLVPTEPEICDRFGDNV